MSPEIAVTTSGSAYRVELNRPECGNLVTMGMVRTLSQALRQMPPEANLVIVAGRGDDFCKGRDYQSAPESAVAGSVAPTASKIREEMTSPMMEFYTTLRELPVPTLSIVQGAAYGFGCALAGACDITLAAESARFRLPEMGRGLPPTLAMSALWGQLPQRAIAYMVYSTAELGARDAQMMGLASAVVPDSELETRAAALADTVCSQPADAVRAVKEYLKEAPSMTFTGRGGYGATLMAAVVSSRY